MVLYFHHEQITSMHVLKAASSLDTYRWLCPAASKQLPVEFSGAEMLVQVIRNVL